MAKLYQWDNLAKGALKGVYDTLEDPVDILVTGSARLTAPSPIVHDNAPFRSGTTRAPLLFLHALSLTTRSTLRQGVACSGFTFRSPSLNRASVLDAFGGTTGSSGSFVKIFVT